MRIAGVTQLSVSATAVTLLTNDLVLTAGLLQFSDVNTTITDATGILQYDVATTFGHDFRVNNVTEYLFNATQADFNGNNLVNAVMTGTVTGVSAITGLGIQAQALDLGGNNLDNIQNLIHDISTSGVDIDFAEDELQTISISVNTTFTTANRVAGKSKTLKITTDATLRTFVFPAWDWVSDIPADQAANKNGYLTLTSYGTTDALIVAAYQVGSL